MHAHPSRSRPTGSSRRARPRPTRTFLVGDVRRARVCTRLARRSDVMPTSASRRRCAHWMTGHWDEQRLRTVDPVAIASPASRGRLGAACTRSDTGGCVGGVEVALDASSADRWRRRPRHRGRAPRRSRSRRTRVRRSTSWCAFTLVDNVASRGRDGEARVRATS